MFVPTYDVICKSLASSHQNLEEVPKVLVPLEFLKFLLRIALANSDFNEPGYLKSNPDIVDALKSGEAASARLHYVQNGYFEGRLGALPDVDQDWYLAHYPDVAAAVKEGKLRSAIEHFAVTGFQEFRAPSAQYELSIREWQRGLQCD